MRDIIEKYNSNRNQLILTEIQHFDLQRKLFDYINNQIIEYFNIKNISYNQINNAENHKTDNYKSFTYFLDNSEFNLVLRFSIDNYYNHLVSYLIIDIRMGLNFYKRFYIDNIDNIAKLDDIIIEAVELLINPPSLINNDYELN